MGARAGVAEALVRSEPKKYFGKFSTTEMAAFAAIFVVLVWFLNLLGIFADSGARGTFGDMFGAANSIFSGLAFAGVVYAILLQREEISIARDELDRTKILLEKQESALEEQNAENQIRRFQDRFFSLLELLQTTISQMDVHKSSNFKESYRGRDCFRQIWDDVLNNYQDRIRRNDTLNILNSYNDIYNKHRSDLGHYYRTMYNIYKFIDNSDISNKEFYTKIVRAQTSDFEVKLLALNCATDRGEKFINYINAYGLLKFLDATEFKNHEHVLAVYDGSAFPPL